MDEINAISNEVLASDKSNDSIKLSSTNGDGTEQIPNILYTDCKCTENRTQQTWLPGS